MAFKTVPKKVTEDLRKVAVVRALLKVENKDSSLFININYTRSRFDRLRYQKIENNVMQETINP